MTTGQDQDSETGTEVCQRVIDDLAMIADRTFVLEDVQIHRADQKVSGKGTIHLSFRLGFHVDGQVLHGCLLMPLPDAISLACYLMMVPDEAVTTRRGEKKLDRATKDALLEIGNFIGGAADAALRKVWGGEVGVRSEGCQGVAPGKTPNFAYQRGNPLLVCEARARLHDFPSFKMLLQMPALEPSA
jgi:hypothetical protein